MNTLAAILHLLSFAAPAFAVALGVALAARIGFRSLAARTTLWASLAINFIAGLAVLAGGLWFFGVDGKMATYGALVVVTASCQWMALRGWRR